MVEGKEPTDKREIIEEEAMIILNRYRRRWVCNSTLRGSRQSRISFCAGPNGDDICNGMAQGWAADIPLTMDPEVSAIPIPLWCREPHRRGHPVLLLDKTKGSQIKLKKGLQLGQM